MDYDTLKSAIKFQMLKELSTLKYGYQSIVEGCFDASQRFTRLEVPQEWLVKMRKECCEEVLVALQIL